MAKFTLLEVHLEGSSLTANAPFSSDDSGAAPSAKSVPEPESGAESSSRRGVATVVGLLFLVAVALAVRKWFAEDEEIDLS